MKQNTKKRLCYALAVLITVILGLGSRKLSAALPAFVADHFGDALWAAMVYFGFCFLFINARPTNIALLSLLFCFFIEFSQLYQADWINEMRQHTLGALVLGKGFLAIDLVRYFVGVVVAYALDKLLLRKRLALKNNTAYY
ncbi:MAG: DUF2809 domain-containing protein [Bacteroidetes bacterium]|nr:DUF2809 domain-containing protein [Bacteroidota bacterium]